MTGWLLSDASTASHAQVMVQASRHAVVCLGERHDQADVHRWQLHVAAGIAAHRPVVMAFEMFPARLDAVLASWVAGDLSEQDFLTAVDWQNVWGFAPELYLHLFRACREMGWQMRGLNVARDLVRQVGAAGWEGVSHDQREGLTPAAPSPEAYRRFIFDLTGGPREGREARDAMDPAFDRFLRAQEVWDRAFAIHLARAASAAPDACVIGIIGMGHLQFGGGVGWQMQSLGHAPPFVLLPHRDGPVPAGAADAHFLLPQRP